MRHCRLYEIYTGLVFGADNDEAIADTIKINVTEDGEEMQPAIELTAYRNTDTPTETLLQMAAAALGSTVALSEPIGLRRVVGVSGEGRPE